MLGAGFGGITVATELRRRLGADHEVVLVDRGAHFLMGLRKLWAVVGSGTLDEGRRPRAQLERHGIRFVQREVRSIDAAARRVTTDDGTLDGDYLVVALGAEPRPELVPGLAEHAHNVYDAAAIPALAAAVARFTGGRIAVVIAGVPYRCPPAPYECALLLDARLRERGLRERTELAVSTLQPILLPNAGREASAWLGTQLDEHGITQRVAAKVAAVEPGRVLYEDGTLEGDVIIGVPPHRPPRVVHDSGLTGGGDWIVVDPATLETAAPRVYAIGDCTHIPLANGLPLPKAGIFAELEGARVAAAIAADVSGGEPPADFDGRGYCFIELGADTASLIDGDFFARPEPLITLHEASPQNAAAKRAFEAERLRRWFGG